MNLIDRDELRRRFERCCGGPYDPFAILDATPVMSCETCHYGDDHMLARCSACRCGDMWVAIEETP
jgi:hypothetical protein